MRIRRHGVLPVVVGLLLGVLSGCGGAEGAAGSDAVKGPLVPDKLVEQAKANPLQPYPSQKGKLPEVRVARSVPALSFAALDLAVAMNFFEYNGVKVKFTELEAGSTALQGLLGGSIDLVDSASVEMAASTDQGADVIALENTSMMTMQICVRKDWAAKKGVDETSDIKDRVRALKGAKIAISGPGSASDRNMRWLLKTYGGLNPDKDVDILQVGGAPAMSGALDENQVQAFMLSAPNCAQSKDGMVLIQPQEVPQFANYIHEVLYGSRDWVEENAGTATRVATAVAMGNNFLLTHTDEAIKLLQKQYSKVDPEVIANAVKDSIIPNVKKHGLMDASMWKNTNKVLTEAGFIKEPLDVGEGQIWTNKYIRKGEAVVH
jgi:NitT/TauT family transport system substrate-binding protein